MDPMSEDCGKEIRKNEEIALIIISISESCDFINIANSYVQFSQRDLVRNVIKF